ncbi:DUF3152 domain-containing protein [Pseudonocardia sp. RS010]|uniref:DUF3152 domain-containing protein n=1 Tax=Pseudonocardia sp. RS010 TaxID=3385979 RepID=UPI0039A139F9
MPSRAAESTPARRAPSGRPRVLSAARLLALCLPALLLVACARPGVNQLAPDPADRTPAVTTPTVTTPAATTPAATTSTATTRPGAPSAAPPAALAAQSAPLPPTSPGTTPTTTALSPVDLRAGLTGRSVPSDGNGSLAVVPGSTPAPGPGPVRELSVAVEAGLPVDPDAFAGFVMDTLNDPRGWGAGGALSFARTDGAATIHLVLATPGTTNRLCAPLDTAGEVSCRNQEMVVLNFRRWVETTAEYADNPTGYRQYLVNHEVGHALGHGHETCPGAGRPAPVMQQQTLGLHGCTHNSWPHP